MKKKKNPIDEFEAEFDKPQKSNAEKDLDKFCEDIRDKRPQFLKDAENDFNRKLVFGEEPTGFDVEPLTDDKGQASLFEMLPDPNHKPYHREDEVWQQGHTVHHEVPTGLGKGLGALFNHPEGFKGLIPESEEGGIIYKPRLWVGIDPGKSGGIAAMAEHGLVGMWAIPKLGDDIDSARLCDILMDLHVSYNMSVIVEDVHSLFGMSASTNFSMGHTLGIIIGVVTASRMRLIRVQPKQWQKEIWVNSDYEYLPIKPQQKKPSVDTKLTSLKAAHRLFPRADFRGEVKVEYYSDNSANRKKGLVGKQIPSKKVKDHDGIVDAVCIAEFGRRKNV